MTITLHLNTDKPKIGQKQRIVNKLNGLLSSASISSTFFDWNGFYLKSSSSANVEKNNRVLIFLSIFCDLHHESYRSFTCFGYGGGMQFYIPDSFLNEFENTLNNIQSTDDIKISLN